MAGVKKGKYCGFCGRSDKEVELLITGLDSCICNECAERAAEIVHESKPTLKKNAFRLDKIPKPQEIKKYLDEYVIGQD
ncbi:MAG: ATP-dependent Clp protease ATP-binding subunit ClpX, partial [Bacteroidaceae bacterium]|nr:ATP-dependent Clp protease ATP-binding subunit ClpX [Bacteroidaceae bacterium]